MTDQKTDTTPFDAQDRRRAYAFIVAMGVVSFFGDITYEGARGITGPFLAMLGASGTIVGIATGAGEMAGFGLRLFSGLLADRTKRYWLIAIFGYIINLVVVPLLALAHNWQFAVTLIILERVAKALRTPSRDTLLAGAAEVVGPGKGFGLHEAMDSAGGLLGPLIMTAILAWDGRYDIAFATLAAPALLAIITLGFAWRRFPDPGKTKARATVQSEAQNQRPFWIAVAALSILAAATVDYPLMAYHFGKTHAIGAEWIPAMYSLAQATNGLASLGFGRLFDRYGSSVLIFAAILAAFAPVLAFLLGPVGAVLGVAVWGLAGGGRDTMARGLIAKMIPAGKRGSAYGIYNAVFGVAWFAGSAVMGWLYDIAPWMLVACSLALHAAAVIVLTLVRAPKR
ncbi:MAG TPA: MFS transporter [Magnetospirillaceae bacterium]